MGCVSSNGGQVVALQPRPSWLYEHRIHNCGGDDAGHLSEGEAKNVSAETVPRSKYNAVQKMSHERRLIIIGTRFYLTRAGGMGCWLAQMRMSLISTGRKIMSS